MVKMIERLARAAGCLHLLTFPWKSAGAVHIDVCKAAKTRATAPPAASAAGPHRVNKKTAKAPLIQREAMQIGADLSCPHPSLSKCEDNGEGKLFLLVKLFARAGGLDDRVFVGRRIVQFLGRCPAVVGETGFAGQARRFRRGLAGIQGLARAGGANDPVLFGRFPLEILRLPDR